MGHSFYPGRGICMTSKSTAADMQFSGLNILTSLCSHPCGIPSLWVSAGLASNQRSSVKVLQYTWLHAPNYVTVLYETTVLIWSLSLSSCKEASGRVGEPHVTRKCGWFLWAEGRLWPRGRKNKTEQTEALSPSNTRNWTLSTTTQAPQWSLQTRNPALVNNLIEAV